MNIIETPTKRQLEMRRQQEEKRRQRIEEWRKRMEEEKIRRNQTAQNLVNLAEKNGLVATLQKFGQNFNVSIPLSKSFCEMHIDNLDLSVRARNGLMRAGAMTVGSLSERIMSETGLQQIRNLGRKSIVEIKTVLLVTAYEKLSSSRKIEFWNNFLGENDFSIQCLLNAI